jgi:hypothetical protein
MKQRANKFLTRRQDDIKDQNAEYSFSQSVQEADTAKYLDVTHQRRLADREARRFVKSFEKKTRS